MIIPLLIQSLSLLSLHLEILNVFRVSRNKKSVLNELMNFSVVEWEFSINLNSSPRINSHFSFLDTDSFKHFQFQKTHGTVILHFGDDVILHFEKGNDFFKWSFIFFRLNAFHESFFCDQIRFLEIMRLHGMAYCWFWARRVTYICYLSR